MSFSFYNYPIHKDSPSIVNAVIEIERGSKNKYEYDVETGAFLFDRGLISAMVYPASYGFIPQTLCEDGDPIDIMVISPEPILRATVVHSKVIGCLDMEDEGQKDYKIISVPSFYGREFSSLSDIEGSFLDISKNFFTHYKDLSPNAGDVKVSDWIDCEGAKRIIKDRIVY